MEAARHAGPLKLSPANTVCGGQLRWIEFRYRSIWQAQRRALLLFLCTYSTSYKEAVPFVHQSLLQSQDLGETVLKLWDIYRLTWTNGEKTALFKLRQKMLSCPVGYAPLCGRDSWAYILRQDWIGVERRIEIASTAASRSVKEAYKPSACVSTSGLSSCGGLVTLSGATLGKMGQVSSRTTTATPSAGLGSVESSPPASPWDDRSGRRQTASPGQLPPRLPSLEATAGRLTARCSTTTYQDTLRLGLATARASSGDRPRRFAFPDTTSTTGIFRTAASRSLTPRDKASSMQHSRLWSVGLQFDNKSGPGKDGIGYPSKWLG